MNKLFKLAAFFLAFTSVSLSLSSCEDSKSYADLLTEESHAVNYFLADHRVAAEFPADSVFETGPDAPYYPLNEDHTLYMQVINPGNPDNKAEYDQLIYYRFTRYNLKLFMRSGTWSGEGNADNLANGSTSFRFDNRYNSSATNYGLGIQEPLKYLGIDCEVNLVVKSQLGPSQEISSVIPFLYNLRYFVSPL